MKLTLWEEMPRSLLFLLDLLHSLQTALLYLAHESLVQLVKEYAAIKSYFATCNLTNECTAEHYLILLMLQSHDKNYWSNLNSIILKCFKHISFYETKNTSQFFAVKLVLILIICSQIYSYSTISETNIAVPKGTMIHNSACCLCKIS